MSLRVMIELEPRTGAFNMAIDEALLEAALERGVATLRLYRWIEPTISLGYFQKPHEAAADPALAGLPVVRRLSGGGAILHDREWTYSTVLPEGHPLACRPLELYVLVHTQIVGWLNENGIAARMRGDVGAAPHAARTQLGNDFGAVESPRRDTFPVNGEASERRHRAEPFLCFGRGDPRDVVLEGHKIVGSAQRRRRGSVLQHGSILLRRSIHAPRFPGLIDLSGRDDLEPALAGVLAARIGSLLGEPFPAILEATELARAAHLAAKCDSPSGLDDDD